MPRFEILEAIEEVRISIAQHRREWFGMLGTDEERADLKAKRTRLHELEAELFSQA